MKLHQAIEKLLIQKGKAMTAREIANELNINKWYKKKDSSLILPNQISARIKRPTYINDFIKHGTLISLANKSTKEPSRKTNLKKVIKKPKIEPLKKNSLSIKPKSNNLIEKNLMNSNSYKSAAEIDNIVPNTPGLYCIRIKNTNKLPKEFRDIVVNRKHNILYIGIASQSLNKRFLNQELRAKGHGTFFRSLGAMLGYRPPKGSLKDKKNKRNYKFNAIDQEKIIKWINMNLEVNWIEYEEDIETLETSLLQKYLPLLNLAKNPASLIRLSQLRAECVRIANN